MTHWTWKIDQQLSCRWISKILNFFGHLKSFGDFRQNPHSEIWLNKRVRDGDLYSFIYSNIQVSMGWQPILVYVLILTHTVPFVLWKWVSWTSKSWHNVVSNLKCSVHIFRGPCPVLHNPSCLAFVMHLIVCILNQKLALHKGYVN